MKRIFTAIVIASACLVVVLYSQTHSLQSSQWYKEANRLYDLDEPTEQTDSTALALFLKLAEKNKGANREIAIDCIIKAGNIHQGYQRFEDANRLYHQAISLNNSYVKSSSISYEAFLYLGSSLYFSNIIDSAQYYFEAASAIAIGNQANKMLPEQDRLYNSLGAIYYESANYQQAKNYFERALEFSSKKDPDYEDMYNGVQSNIANCLMKLNQYDSALKILRSLSPQEQQKNIIRQNTAHSFFELGQYDSALVIYDSLPLQNNFSSLLALTDLGRIYMNRKQWQKAEVVFDSAIARNKSISSIIKNKEEALAYLYRSKLAEEQGLIDEAITWNNEALQEVHLQFNWKTNFDLPLDVSETVSPITLFRILHAKAGLLHKKYIRVEDEPFITASLAAYRKAIETANFIKRNFDNDEAKLFFNTNYRLIYDEAIEVAYKAVLLNEKYADDYFFILENYKGSILYQNLLNVQLKSTAAIPERIRRREKEIKQLLAVYISRINQNTVEKEAGELQKKLLSLRVELSRLQKQYDQDAVYNLYRNQQNETQLDISAVQSELDDKTALLNYYSASNAYYCFVVTKKKFLVRKINVDSSFQQSIREFLDITYQFEEGRRYEGFTAAATLYKYLVKPIESIADSYENWVVIPDGLLYYVPFDALVSDQEKRDYLVFSKTISYHYSIALLLGKNTHHVANDSKKVLAFAPYIQVDKNIGTDSLPDLPLSGEEISVITKNIFAGEKALKQTFLAQATKYPIIHLATHASAGTDSGSNWIHFYPSDSNDINNKLFVHEIYNMDLHQAELIVLSACETGGGASVAGEGLLSLSRAFMYAGADGIISTLWKTEDRVTAYLMQRMHLYLEKKHSPEKALQLAKKDLLMDKVMGSQFKTPNYWANFIYTGKLHAEKASNSKWWWILAGFLTLLLVAILYKLKRKSRANTISATFLI